MRRFCLFIAIMFGAGTAVAQEGTAGSLMPLEQAIREARATPTVKGLAEAARAKQSANERISSLTTSPTIFTTNGTRPDLPPPRFETEVGANMPFYLSGFSGARKRSARLEAEALAASVGVVSLTHELEAVSLWFRLWEAEHDLARARQEAELANSFLSKVERAVSLQALTVADLAEAKAYAGEALLNAVNAEGELFDSGLSLARSLGRPATMPLRAALDVPALPKGAALTGDQITARAKQLPAIAQLQRLADAEQARLREYEASRGPLLQVGGSAIHDVKVGTGGVLSLALTLPVADRWREAGDMVAAYERLQGEFQTGLASAVTDLTMAQHEVEHTQEVLEVLEKQVVPALKQAVKERERLFDMGEGILLEVIVARRAVVSAETRLSRARAAHGAAVWRWKLLLDVTDRPQGEAR